MLLRENEVLDFATFFIPFSWNLVNKMANMQVKPSKYDQR